MEERGGLKFPHHQVDGPVKPLVGLIVIKEEFPHKQQEVQLYGTEKDLTILKKMHFEIYFRFMTALRGKKNNNLLVFFRLIRKIQSFYCYVQRSSSADRIHKIMFTGSD